MSKSRQSLRTDEHSLQVSLRQKVRFLQSVTSYDEAPPRVESVETHHSWVFLTPRFAYKLKKPVRYPFIDLGTAQSRYRNCLQEVRLNRRLAADVYLGILELSVDRWGNLQWGEGHETIDWLVHMRRLDSNHMLDRRLQKGEVSALEIQTLAEKLAGFYRDQPAVGLLPEEYRERLLRELEYCRLEIEASPFTALVSQAGRVSDGQRNWLTENSLLFDRRVGEGRISEGHGDLRPEHICLEKEPVIIDCLEFDRRYRLLDPADELAFLALECERLGEGRIGESILRAYCEASGDRPPPLLVSFYRSLRSLVRARLAVWHASDPFPHGSRKWLKRAERYLQLSEKYAPGHSRCSEKQE